MGGLRTAVPVVFTSLALAQAALGAFVNGVERFEGPTLDTETWQPLRTVGIGHGPGGLWMSANGEANFYTTRQLTVGVGELAEAEITVSRYTGQQVRTGILGFYLTTKSNGTADAITGSESLAIESIDLFKGTYAYVRSDGFAITGEWLFDDYHRVGKTYRYRITRESSTSARYQLFEGDRVLGDLTRQFQGIPDELYVSLYASAVTFTVSRVTVTPEPRPLVVVAAAGMLAVLRRRRGGVPTSRSRTALV